MSGPRSIRSARPKVVIAFAAVYLIWGSTYLTIRIAIDSFPPFLMAGARFVLAGALLFAFVRRPGVPREPITAAQWRSALIIGACLLLAGNGLVTWGEQYVPTGLVSLIVATVPLWMALFAPLAGGPRVHWVAAVGIAVGLVGVVLLLRPGGAAPNEWQTYVVPASPLLWALGSLYAQRAPVPRQALTATAMEMIGGGALLAIAGLATGELGRIHPASITAASVWAFAYLVLVGALVGYSAYIWLLHNVSSTAASTYAYVNPLVAVVLGAIVLGERLSPLTLLAGAMIIAAVALILSGRHSAPRPVARRLDARVRDVARSPHRRLGHGHHGDNVVR
jgi:drug/metabolite transporter (DMT)-like permease